MDRSLSLDLDHDVGWLTPQRERRLLILLLVVGFFLRAYPVLWSSAHYNPGAYGFHPDEPKLVRHIDDFPESLRTYEDYRYPTLIPFTYGALWMGVGGALGLRDAEPSMPGTPSYEAALLFGRGITLLVFGLGGMWLTWAFTRRLFGPGPALFALGATNLMGLPLTSASLVQTDVPSTVLLLAVFHLLARCTSKPKLCTRDFIWVGLTLGAAAAAKYTSVIGATVVIAVVASAARRGDTTWREGAKLLCAAGLASALAFLLFVPGVLYDFEQFRSSLNYELHSKVLEADAGLNDLWGALSQSYPLWVLAPALLGLLFALKTRRSVLLGAVLACMAIFAVVWTRRLMPDHAIFFFPYVAALAGLGLWQVSRLQSRRAAQLVLAALFLFGHGYSAWVVHQRYASDLRYSLAHWIQENIPPGPIGVSPCATRPLSANLLPQGYEVVSVHTKPEWIVVYKSHYNLVRRVNEDPEQYKQEIAWMFDGDLERVLSLEPGQRRMGRFRERDFRFFEDVMRGDRVEFQYDRVLSLESQKLPLDHMSRPIYVFRRSQSR
jgi:hypothetical protein